MMLHAIVIALLMQATPAVAPASVSGVVVQTGTNEPLANVRVSLARTDAALGMFGQMVAGDHPPAEVTIPNELLAAMAEQITSQTDIGAVPAEEAAAAKAMATLPIADIQEIIVSVSGDVAVVFKSAPPVMTDSQGRFAFNNVEPGTYKLVFVGNGFARQEYGQRSAAGSGIPIVLTADQRKADIVMRMSQVSALSGRISDNAGRPIAGVPVQVLRFAYDETGQRKVQRIASAQTDDRGDYRIFHLSPGRYYLYAGNQPGQTGPAGLSAELLTLGAGPIVNTNRIPEKYSLSYYPGVADPNSAAPIDVPSGADLSGVNMNLRVQQTYRVRGNVVDSRNGQPPPAASLSLNLQTPDPLSGSFVNFSDGSPNYNAADGSFELRNVSSGAYLLSVTLPAPPSQRPPDIANMSPADQRAYFDAMSAASAAAPRASAAINVVNSDLDGVQLRVGIAGSIAGTVRSEQSQASPAPELTFLRIQLMSADGPSAQARPPKPDGTFRIESILPGEYRLAVNGLPAGFYLKEARLGETNLLSDHFRFAGAESGMLSIVISSNSGQIDGNASSMTGQPMPGSRVVLIPESNRDRSELFRPVTADPVGHFIVSNVAPGDYKLAAWEAIEPFAFFDPDLIKQADDTGKLVHVAESSKQTVNITPIPAGLQ
jgi:hypothetical protein